ncbi:MAG: class I SAM-dependent methyltransferase [Bacteroidota bacterium]|nr:class I SAM-dependent methyltransferase [Bacteroidota bacterium]
MDNEKKIIDSWTTNAANWIEIIDNNGIESRRLITNKAIVDAVWSNKPASALDAGCGEGWLTKELNDKGIEMTGVDVIPELIERAREKEKGDFLVASYEDIVSGKIVLSKLFDAIVINFALIAKESTENLLTALPRYLAAGGKLLIQTLHPFSRKAIDDYNSGWKEGSWDGLGEQFTLPYQWYFRTLEDWLLLLDRSGFHSIKVTEVLHPQSAKPLSVIFECTSH